MPIQQKKSFLIVAAASIALIVASAIFVMRSQVFPSENSPGGNVVAAMRIEDPAVHPVPPRPRQSNNITEGAGSSVVMTSKAIYADESKTLSDRFDRLTQKAVSGDKDASHLAYQIALNCAAWVKMSQTTVLPSLWTPEMASALDTVHAECANISNIPAYKDYQQIASQQGRDFFDQGIADSIREAFADHGLDSALGTAMSSFQNRPDPETARMIASTLNELDLTKFNSKFNIDGLSSFDPATRATLLESGLDLWACDLGVPCDAGSQVVLSLCINGGICAPGLSLEEIYAQRLLSGSEMMNVRKILQALRNVH